MNRWCCFLLLLSLAAFSCCFLLLRSINVLLRFCPRSRAHVRATELLVHLGFSSELQARKMRALSGGWRVRVALAAAIFARPDVLLLDEPTNHLSIQAVLWLANELKNGEVWKVSRCFCRGPVDTSRHFSTLLSVLHSLRTGSS